jgi:hypothetical protein
MCSWTLGGWKRQGILQPLAHHHQLGVEVLRNTHWRNLIHASRAAAPHHHSTLLAAANSYRQVYHLDSQSVVAQRFSTSEAVESVGIKALLQRYSINTRLNRYDSPGIVEKGLRRDYECLRAERFTASGQAALEIGHQRI